MNKGDPFKEARRTGCAAWLVWGLSMRKLRRRATRAES